MADNLQATQVLAVASHVTYGYVGNKMATLVMQALGCDVSAINTVYFSNHTGYKRWKGRKVPAEEIQDLYDGLKNCDLNHFDMLLSGYIASKDAVETVGSIARDLRLSSKMKPGSFFWLLDPVMGDEGRLYVNEDIVPAYKSLLHEADLILPNSFEAELLSDVKITSKATLVAAITKLHKTYRIPHIIVTSVHISLEEGQEQSDTDSTLVVFGSSCRSDYAPRIFSVSVPRIPVFFSGTGDMFAALTAVRHREAVASVSPALLSTRSWMPPDDLPAVDLPLARATERSLSSMHKVLTKTARQRDRELEASLHMDGGLKNADHLTHERKTRASEVRVIQCMEDLKNPSGVHDPGLFEALAVDITSSKT